jgi:hypothetical protein
MENKIKNYRNAVLILFLVVASFAIWKFVDAYANKIDPASYRTFAVSGEGKSIVVPDVAEFSFSVVTEGGVDIATLQTENTKKMNSAIQYLKGNGVNEKDIKTQNYNLSPRYQYSSCALGGVCPPPQIVGYTITQGVLVKVRDFKKIGELLAGVVKNGANTVSDMRFTVDDMTTVQNTARTEAIQKAKDKAKAIAKAGGFDVGKLLSIDEGMSPVPYMDNRSVLGMGGVASEKAMAPQIEAGSQEVTINVTLRYEIKN